MKWYLFVFLICTLTAIAVLPQASAVSVTRYSNYNVTDFGNGTHIFLGGLSPRLADGAGHYTQDYYLFNNNNGSSYTIATGFGTYVFVKQSCGLKVFPPTLNPGNNKASINSITYTVAHSSGNNFIRDRQLNNCVINVINTPSYLQLNATRQNANVTIIASYTINSGKPLEVSYNLIPKISNMLWKITESQSDIPNVIQTNVATYQENNKYDPSNSTTRVITNSIRNGGHVVNYLEPTGKKIFYDYQTSVLALAKTGINLNVTSGKTQLFNDFQTDSTLNATQSFVVDPVLGYTTTSWNYQINDQSPTCANVGPFTNSSLAAGDGHVFNYASGAGVGSFCQLSILRWDLSSIPISAIVNDVKIKFDADPFGNKDCQFFSLETPHTSSLTTAWNDAQDGIAFLPNNNVPPATGNNFCVGPANGQVFDLNVTGVINVQNHLGLYNSLWGVGFTFWQNDHDGGVNSAADLHAVQLQITYNSPQAIIVRAFQHDNTTAIYPGNVLDHNNTRTVTLSTNTTGHAGPFHTGGGTLQNFTIRDLTSNYVINKTLNYNPSKNTTFSSKTFAFQVDCPSNGAGNDILLEVNDTDGHHVTSFSTPTCSSNSTITWNTKFSANGNSLNTFQSTIYGKVLSPASYGSDPLFIIINGTQYTTSYNAGTNTITSNPFTVGTGTQTKTFSFSMRLLGPTLPSAPRSLTAVPSGNDKITLNWLPPTNNGSSAIFGYHIFRNSTTLVNNTGTLTLTYTNTGIAANHKQTYQLCAWNSFGCSALSNQAYNFTYAATTATASLNYTRVGNMIGVSPAINVITANPNPTVTKIELYNKTTLVQTTNPNTIAITGAKTFLPLMYHGLLGSGANSNYTVKISLSNATGADKVFTSNATGLISRQYFPAYFAAMDTSQGNVNYTIARTADQKQVILQSNRDKNAALFKMECLYQRASQIAQTPQQTNTGLWDNHTNIGYYKYSYNDVTGSQNIYVSCYNGGLLFTTTSYANATLLAGIQYFDSTFQGFIGVPVGVFFILLVAGLATGRTAPTITVIVLAVAAIMAGIGFFTISQPVWGLCLIACSAALFGGKKFL